MATIAVIFDFDDTLVPDSTTALLRRYGVDPEKFWSELASALVSEGYDHPSRICASYWIVSVTISHSALCATKTCGNSARVSTRCSTPDYRACSPT